MTVSGLRSMSSQSTRRANRCSRSLQSRGLRLELEPVLADVDELVEPDDPPRVGARPAADAGDERVPAVQAAKLGACLLRHDGLVRDVDDRGEHAVDVEQERRPLRCLGELREQRGRDHGLRRIRRCGSSRIGLVAGFFSALFGVGGGLVAVPLADPGRGLPAARGDGDLARRDRDHRARGRRSSMPSRAVTSTRATRCSSGSRAAAGAVAGHGLQQRALGPRARRSRSRRSSSRVALWLLRPLGVKRTRGTSATPAPRRIAAALGLGLAAGALAGLFGVGGGLLFVPTLVWLGLGQLEAEATSLLAILPTVAAGAWRQHRYGNLRRRAALVLGLASVAAVELGVLVAKALPEHDAAGALRACCCSPSPPSSPGASR